jgi:hypothetical protein
MSLLTVVDAGERVDYVASSSTRKGGLVGRARCHPVRAFVLLVL